MGRSHCGISIETATAFIHSFFLLHFRYGISGSLIFSPGIAFFLRWGRMGRELVLSALSKDLMAACWYAIS